jgi:hypothetical protein
MRRKFKNIASLFLLLVFLLPAIVKFEHHHQNYAIVLKNGRHTPVLQNNCPICNFELSIFISNIENIHIQNEYFSDAYFNNYNSRYSFNLSKFSFLLRAPPAIQV